jgi:hypothetical protein
MRFLPLCVLSLLALHCHDENDLFHHDEEECLAPSSAARARELRDPQTGECQLIYNDCPPCAPCDGPVGSNDLTWGECDSGCEGLDENACKTQPACRAIYGATTQQFLECWATDQNRGNADEPCEGLLAYRCSLRDDCSAVHLELCDSQTQSCRRTDFQECRDETPANF